MRGGCGYLLSADQLVRTNSAILEQTSLHDGSASGDDCVDERSAASCVRQRFPDGSLHYVCTAYIVSLFRLLWVKSTHVCVFNCNLHV